MPVARRATMENLPFREFDHNAVWLELSLIAQDVIAWTQLLALDGELAICEPKTLRYRLLHTAARLAFHARRALKPTLSDDEHAHGSVALTAARNRPRSAPTFLQQRPALNSQARQTALTSHNAPTAHNGHPPASFMNDPG